MHIVLAGGSGFVGQKLQVYLLDSGHKVTILTRNTDKIKQTERLRAVLWLQKDSHPEQELIDVDAIVNLAGESINGLRWTKNKKEKIVESRLTATREIMRIISQLHRKPKVLINASAIGYYGMSETEQFTESVETHANDFLADVVKMWEEEAEKANEYHVRTVIARFGLILGDQGALPLMMIPYKLKIGGTIGSGRQWVSWIHVEDVAAMIDYAIQNPMIIGAMNVTAPNPVRMSEFGRTISSVLRSPHWLPVPSILLRLGLGEMSAMLVKGQYVIPEKAMETGYSFRHPTINDALVEITSN